MAVENWSQLDAKTPTTLVLFSVIVEQSSSGTVAYRYVAEVCDQHGQRCHQLTGDLSPYVSQGVIDQLGQWIESIYAKAESEMLP